MQTKDKNTDLLRFVKRFNYRQTIVYSDEGNLDHIANVISELQYLKYSEKPRGLWFSLGKAWVRWLNDPDVEPSWRTKRLSWITHIYRIYLSESVLQIWTKRQFRAFERKYANKGRTAVNWGKVSDDYDGILIRYRDYGSPWHEDWDVSSGCIWYRSGIRKTKLLKKWELTWKK